MKRVIEYNNQTPTEDGIVSFISWDNPALAEALIKLFNVKSYEILQGFIITEDGVKASFRYNNLV